ncbi:helix-turn-helix domain-containing protein [Saccharothrix sp. Mg75]|uniref:helix-turn-helix domain-containing protein n=1 Tax=Saccharothrix sp. Mg75 TaxID=3445357 RepID=UPI003EEC5972
MGKLLAAFIDSSGVTRSDLARATNYDRTSISHICAGRQSPEKIFWEMADAHLKAGGRLVAAHEKAMDIERATRRNELERGLVKLRDQEKPAVDPIRIAHEWLVADTPGIIRQNAGQRVGKTLVEELERRVIELRHLDDVVYGDDLYPLVRKELSKVEKIVRSASYSEPTGKRLLSIIGETAQLAGWVASDAGRYSEAQQLYLDGAGAAREAGDRILTAQLLSSLSYQMASVGNAEDAALLARTATKGADGASPVVKTLLLERVAWASARTRDRSTTMRALDAVDDTYEERSDDTEEPEWVYWLNRDEIDVMAGRCLIELGRPSEAEPLLSRAISSYDNNHVREVALYLSWLAEAFAKADVLDAAEETLDRARVAARGVNSKRLDIRIRQVESLTANRR